MEEGHVFELEIQHDKFHLLINPPEDDDPNTRIVFAVNKKGVTSAIIEKTADALTADDIKSGHLWKQRSGKK